MNEKIETALILKINDLKSLLISIAILNGIYLFDKYICYNSKWTNRQLFAVHDCNYTGYDISKFTINLTIIDNPKVYTIWYFWTVQVCSVPLKINGRGTEK